MWGCTGRKGGVELVRVRSQRRSHGVAVQVCSCTGRKGEVAVVRVRSQRRSDGVAVLGSFKCPFVLARNQRICFS